MNWQSKIEMLPVFCFYSAELCSFVGSIIRLVFSLAHLLSPSGSLPPTPLTQINTVVLVDLYPELVHLCVPLGVRVPQNLALHIHNFLTLSFRVFRHLCCVPLPPVNNELKRIPSALWKLSAPEVTAPDKSDHRTAT